MAITQITAGQKDWLSVLNNDLSQIGDKVATTAYPVTLTNGWKGSLTCNSWKIGSHWLSIVSGWLSGKDVTPNQDVEFATMPSGAPSHLFSNYIYPQRASTIGDISTTTDSSGMVHLRMYIPGSVYSGPTLNVFALEIW